KINIADLGQGAQDGFTEYSPGPRWGDYTWAMFVPTTPGSAHGNIYFATEYIQSPNCDYATWSVDPSCGGTRDPLANWGTSVNYLTV
ncbi:MAG TPA: hypothetical protein VEG61_05075, partial [Candidatus Dormibacteraeota bacterium]|nr:hypothetical protein [Candidatus Dormibacteraeota bacterium]